nr:hypothetical protein [Syntrophales bacterium]
HQQDLKNRVTGAKNWRADGEAKQKAGKIPEAVASYRQSLKLLPDAALEEHVRILEGKQAEAGEKKASADKLWQEGTALLNQGRPSDALTKFKESLGYWSEAPRTKYVSDLEARRAKAVALRNEGAKLQQGNRIPEAIAKYKESLSYWPDTGLASHIATLEGKVKQDAEAAARKAKAKHLRDEGYALQQKNQLQAAVGKYKESLAVWPDKELENYIRQLEVKIAAASTPVTPSTPTGPTVSATSSTQKPGGTAAETAAGYWAGAWKSDPGPDGEVVTFSLSQSGSRLTGSFQVDVPYTAASGARQKETLRGTIDGTVSGSRVTGTFREGSDKGATGTFEFTMAPGGNVFTAAVRGDETSDTYTVRRSGASASAGSSASSGRTAPRAVTAELTNRSRENTHIFADGESFGPANRLAPGEKRKVSVSMKADGSVTFKAGRNGQVMATKIWRGTPGDSTRVPVVVFDDTNPYDKLTVTTGLR